MKFTERMCYKECEYDSPRFEIINREKMDSLTM